MEYSKFLPFNEHYIIKILKSIFIVFRHNNALFGLIPNDDIKTLINYSVILNKLKLFELLMKIININFIEGIIENKNYSNLNITKYEISYYMNNYICMLLSRFFKYFLLRTKEQHKIKLILQKIKIFPRIYNILTNIVDNGDKNNITLSFTSINNDINKYDNFINNMKSNDKNLTYENSINLISIGTEIGLILFLYGHNIISIDLGITNNVVHLNSDLLNKYIVLISKIYNICESINKYKENFPIKNIPVFSLLNAFGVYSITNYLPLINKYYELVNNMNNLNDKECYLKKYLPNSNINESIIHYFDKKNNIIYEESISTFRNLNLFNFISKISDLIKEDKYKNNFETIYRLLFDIMTNENEIIKNYIDNEYEFNQIIKYLNEIPYEGEYLIDKCKIKKEYYLSQVKILFKNNKFIFKHIVNEILSQNKRTNNMNSNDINIKLINYILFSNLIGGMIKIYYTFNNNNQNNNEVRYDFISSYYLDKYFSYIHGLNLINNYYNKNLNQLLIIIWLRKIYNCVFCYFYNNEKDKDNIYKLYTDKNSNDIKLNVKDINQILIDNNSKDKIFIEKYFYVLSLFIRENKKGTGIEDIKSYFSQIYFSLMTLDKQKGLIDNKNLERKINNILDEMRTCKHLLYKKELLKEVIISYNEELKKEIIIEKYGEIYLEYDLEEDDDFNEEFEEDMEIDYENIEQNLTKKALKSRRNCY